MALGQILASVETAEPTQALHQLTGWALQRGLVLGRLTVDRPSPAASSGSPLPTHWLALALALVLGAASFCALGVAVASLHPQLRGQRRRSVQLVLFPLLFISGHVHADSLQRAQPHRRALPVRPFNQALLGPFAQHAGVDWKSLGVLAAWGAAGALVAIRRFRWDPRPE